MPAGMDGQLQTIPYAKLGVDDRQLVPDRLFAQSQLAGYLTVRRSGQQSVKDLLLSRRQPPRHGCWVICLIGRGLRRTVRNAIDHEAERHIVPA